MKTQKIHTSILLLILAVAVAPFSVPGAQISLLTNDASGTTSFTGSTNWSNGSAPNGANNYLTGPYFMRTPTTAGNFTFAGNSLTLLPGNTNTQGTPIRSLIYKGPGTNIYTINNLTNAGGTINSGAGNVAPPTFTGNLMTVVSNSTIMADQGSFIIGYNIAGSADLTNTSGQGRTNFYTGNLSAFTGRLMITGGITVALQALNSVPGNPAVSTPTQISLDAGTTLLDFVGVTLNNPNGGINLTGAATINVTSNNMTVAEPITDNGFILTKRGGATLTLAANNNLTGGIALAVFTTGSQLNINSPGALGQDLACDFDLPGGFTSPALIDNTSGSAIVMTGGNQQFWSNSVTFIGSSSLDMASANGFGIVTIYAPITVTVSNNTFTVGQITDNGSNFAFNVVGPGTLALYGGFTSFGAVTVSNGTLAVTGSGTVASTNINLLTSTSTLDLSTVGGLSMAANQTLGGSGTVNGSVTDNSGVTIFPGGKNNPGTLTVNGGLTFNGGTTLNYDITNVTTVGSGVNDLIVVNGALNVNGPTTINVLGVPAVGTYTLFQYTSFSGSIANFTVPVGFAVSNNVTAKAIQLLVTTVPLQLTWKGDGVANAWDLGVSQNWVDNGTNEFFFTGDTVTFTDTGSDHPPINVTGSISPEATIVNSTQNYDFTNAGINSGSLTKLGSGTLILENNNTYSGGTLISAGALQIGNDTNGGASGALGGGGITNNAALVFDLEITNTLAAPILGTGNITNKGPTPGLITLSGSISGNSVSQVGSGDLVLTASNTYTGLTLVTNGTLHVRNAWALGSPAGGTVVSNTGSLFIDQNVDLTNEPLSLGGSGLSSSGALHKGGAGATMIGGLVTLSASTTINIDGGSTLNLSNGNGITGNNVSLTLNVVGSGTNAGPISLGTGSLIVSGSGSWTLPATDTYTGLTTLNGGTLFIPALSALGPVSVATPNYITFSGGTLGALSSLNFTDSFHGMTVVAGSNAGFNIATNMTVTISNNITGSGTIVKSGPGTLLLDGSNSFSGVLSLDRGIDGNNNDGLTIITRTDAVANVTTIQTLNTSVSTAGGAILELAPTSAGMTFPQEFILGCRDNMTTPTILNNNGTNTIAGFTALQIGGNIVNYSASAGSELIISGNVQFIGTLTALRDLYFSGAGAVLVTGNILVSSNGITPVGIIKDNTGTLTLSGANTYSDSTTVSNGLLLLTGSINSTNPVIVAGGTFAGTGTVVNTNVEVLAGGFLAPGAPTGTMTIDSALTVSGTLAINVNKSLALTNGEIALTGAFTNTGTGAILVSNLGPALAVGNKFPVFTAAVPGANTLTVSGAGAVWTNNLAVDGTIQVVSVTVPHPVITTATLVGTNLVLHGTNGVAGGPFNVRSSTNVAAPLSTWVVEQSGVYDGSGNFNVTNAITNSIPKKFYILQQ